MHVNPQTKRIAAQALSLIGSQLSRIQSHRIRRHGVSLDLSSSLLGNTTRGNMFFGFYENAERRSITRFLRPDVPVVELGSSIGFVAGLIAQQLNPGVAQVAVEANPALIPVLGHNLTLNRLTHIQVVEAAVAYQCGKTVAFAQSGSSTSSRRTRFLEVPGQHTILEVQALSLSDILERAGIDGPFSLVADIEGAEFEVFQHEHPDILSRCKQVIIELHAVKDGDQALSPLDLARLIEEKSPLSTAHRDGNVFVFQ